MAKILEESSCIQKFDFQDQFFQTMLASVFHCLVYNTSTNFN